MSGLLGGRAIPTSVFYYTILFVYVRWPTVNPTLQASLTGIGHATATAQDLITRFLGGIRSADIKKCFAVARRMSNFGVKLYEDCAVYTALHEALLRRVGGE